MKKKDKPKKCPNCGSTNIVYCPDSTNLVPVKGIWWICEDCLEEF